MKFFKYSILALAAVSMATTFTACSDDDDYTPGAAASGVFFEAEASAALEVSKTADSFSVTIARSGNTAAATYGIVAETDAPEGALTFPASVTFAEGAGTAQYVIAMDPELMEDTYTVTLSFADGVQVGPYGESTYSFTIKTAKAYDNWKAFATGTGSFDYALNFLFNGDDPGLPIFYRTNIDDPNDVQLWIQHLYLDQDFFMDLDLESGEITVPIQGLYEDGELIQINSGAYDMYVMDLYTYAINFEPTAMEQFKGASFYDSETGLFYLALAYAGQDTSDPDNWGLFQGSYGYEYFQMDGFTNANVDIAFDGSYIDKNGVASAMFTVSVGEAASKGLVGISKTLKGDKLAYAVAMGQVEGVETGIGEKLQVLVPVDGSGTYDAAIVSFVDDEPEMYMTISFRIQGLGGGDADADWTSNGVGELTDGWITARYTFTYNDGSGQATFEDIPWEVMIEKSTKTAGLYRMVDPWSDPNSAPVQIDYNEDPQPAYVEIDCSNPNFVKIAPQYSGCSMTMPGEMKASKIDVGDYSFMVGEENKDGDIITEEMITNNGLNTILEDDIVYVPEGACLFGYNDEFGYSWRDKDGNYIGYGVIYLGDPSTKVAKRQMAQKRAADLTAVARAFNPCGTKIQLMPAGHKAPLKVQPSLQFNFRKNK